MSPSVEAAAVAVALLACDESDSRLAWLGDVAVVGSSSAVGNTIGSGADADLSDVRAAVGVSVAEDRASVEIVGT